MHTIRNRFTWVKLVGVLVTLMGASMVGFSDRGETRLVGDLWSLVGAMCYALYAVLLRHLAPDHSRLHAPMLLAFVGVLNFVFLWPVGFILDLTGYSLHHTTSSDIPSYLALIVPTPTPKSVAQTDQSTKQHAWCSGDRRLTSLCDRHTFLGGLRWVGLGWVGLADNRLQSRTVFVAIWIGVGIPGAQWPDRHCSIGLPVDGCSASYLTGGWHARSDLDHTAIDGDGCHITCADLQCLVYCWLRGSSGGFCSSQRQYRRCCLRVCAETVHSKRSIGS
jgi:hypothetical protein